MSNPQTGQVVIYRHEQHGYKLPAIITATIDTIDPNGVERGDYPPLPNATTVHLHVFTPQTVAQYQVRSVPMGTDPGQWAPIN